MLIAMGIASFFCVFWDAIPGGYILFCQRSSGYHPFDATHVITQLKSFFSAMAFILLNFWGKYPPELPSVN